MLGYLNSSLHVQRKNVCKTHVQVHVYGLSLSSWVVQVEAGVLPKVIMHSEDPTTGQWIKGFRGFPRFYSNC